jgi:aryl sulfotransferase
MKNNADSLSQLGATAFEGGLKSFIHKGVNGRWRDVLGRDPPEVTNQRRASTRMRHIRTAWKNSLEAA